MKNCTVYKNEFRKKKPIKNNINISTEYDPLVGPNLDPKSIYLKDYEGRPSTV